MHRVLDALLFVASFQTTLKSVIFSQRETSGKNYQKTAASNEHFSLSRATVIQQLRNTLPLSLSAKIISRNNTSK